MVLNPTVVPHPFSSPTFKRKCGTGVPFIANLKSSSSVKTTKLSTSVSHFLSAMLDLCQWMLSELSYAEIKIKLYSSLFPVSDRWMASWRQSCGMRLSPGTRKPRRTRPCPCLLPANRRIWTPSSWCPWSRRLSQPLWPASTTWPSLRVERAKSTPWWPQPIVWTTCAAWTLPGTPGSEKAAGTQRWAEVGRKRLCGAG